MSEPASEKAAHPRKRSRWLVRALAGVFGLVLLAGIGVAGALVRLSFGPIDLAAFAPTIRDAIERGMPPGHSVLMGDLRAEWGDSGPTLRVRDLVVRAEGGATVMLAPAADIGLHLGGLLMGRAEPFSVVMRDPRLGVSIAPNGLISPGDGPGFAEDGESVSLLQAIGPLLTARTAQEGAFSPGAQTGMTSVQLRGVRLAIFEERTSIRRVVAPFDVTFSRTGDVLDALVLAQSAQGPIRIHSRIVPQGAERRLSVEASGISLTGLASEELARASGAATLDVSLAGTLDPQGGVSRMAGFATIGGFRFVMEGVTTEVPAQRFELALDPAARRLDILPSPFTKPGIQGQLTAQMIWPAQNDPTQLTRINAVVDNVSFDNRTRRHQALGRIELRAGLEARERRFWIDRVIAGPLEGPPLVEATGSLGLFGDSPELRLSAVGRNLPYAMLRDVWPAFMIPPLRQWLLENVIAGEVTNAEVELNVPSGWMARQLPLRNEMFSGRYVLAGVSMRPTPEQPAIEGLNGIVTATGSSSRTEASGGQARYGAHTLSLGQTVYVCEEVHLPGASCQLTTSVTGPLVAQIDAADRQGAGVVRASGLEMRQINGEGTARLRIGIPVGPGARPADITYTVEGEYRAVVVRGLLEDIDLERGALRLKAENRGFELTGTGSIAGATVRLTARSDQPRRVMLRAELDTTDEVRKRLGLELGDLVSGTAPVRLIRDINGTETVQRIEADLTNTRLQIEPLAFDKARGVPASISFVTRDLPRGGTLLDDVLFQGRGFSVRGRIRLNEDGLPSLIEVTEGRLRPDDAFSGRYERDGDRQTVRVTGRSIDARPFLTRFLSDVDVAAPAISPDRRSRLDISVRVDRVIGANNQSISEARLEMSRLGAQMTAFTLGGSLGGATRVTGQILSDQGRPYMMIQATDAGALLRFADLYTNMVGGRLTLTQTLTDPSARAADGVLFVQDFRLRNDPMFERLFGATAAIDTTPGARPGRVVEQTVIDRFRVNFSRGSGVTEVREGSMRNATLGITFEGRVDFRRNRLDLKGTAIPAFAINNLFARVPIIGALLGGQDGGLLGVTYQLQGRIASPELAINPVSAIAPGFLRNIFQFPDPPGLNRE